MSSARPNLVFVLADDLGYADLGCYGARASFTPNLDRMAAQGLRFTDGYANSPVCSPTRFALMTGRYQYRLRGAAEEPIAGSARGRADLGLPSSHPTLPSLLRAAGYHTALVGKWHLGYAPHFSPLASGYDEFFGPLGGGIDYFSHCDRAGVHDLYDGEREVHCSGYVTDLISDRACEVIRRQRDLPFMLSVHYTAPHWPWETRDDEAQSRRIGNQILHLDGGSVEIYRTMIRQMDEGIGRILEALEGEGLARNTLVVFTSDNGGERFSYNWPFRGQKFSLWEGGIRVPAIVNWPGVVPTGVVTQQAAITMDWTRTMLAAGGAKPDAGYPLDGHDLLPVIRGTKPIYERNFFWRTSVQDAALKGHWKYLKDGADEYLFDLSVDAREQANFKESNPAMFSQLRGEFQKWDATVLARPPDRRRS